MFRRLTAWLGGLAFRRAIAVACALAILAVGFAHTLHHFDGKASQTGYEVSSVIGVDGSADPEKPLAPSGDHCHACSMIAVLDQPETVNILTTSEPFSIGLVSLRQRSPTYETPPPIRSI